MDGGTCRESGLKYTGSERAGQRLRAARSCSRAGNFTRSKPGQMQAPDVDTGRVPRDEHARLVPERDTVAEPRAVRIRELVDGHGFARGIVPADPAFAVDAVCGGDERLAIRREPHPGALGEDGLALASPIAHLAAVRLVHGRLEAAGQSEHVLAAS